MNSKIGCPLASGKTYLRCSTYAEGVCGTDTKQPTTGVCILRELINLWNKAGFDSSFMVTEQTIRTRIIKKVMQYHSLKMLKTLDLPEGSYKKKVTSFLKESTVLFPIHKENIFDMIKSDPNRDEEAKKEDIKFLKHCLSGVMVKMANIDKGFQENVHRAEEKLRKMAEKLQKLEDKQKRKEEDLAEREMELSFSTDSESLPDSDTPFEVPTTTKKISDGTKVCLQLSMEDLLSSWIPIMTRYGIGVRPGTNLLASLYNAGGVDIDEMRMSKSTLSRRTHLVVESEAQIIREENLDKIRGLKLVIHFDTKIVKQYTREKGISTDDERLAISASSPESGPLDFLLGVLEIESSKGSDQALAIQSILEYYELSDQIIGVCTDTTSSNTGKEKGAIRNIVVHALERPVLWLMCRHHIYERHVAHVMRIILGPTKGPSKGLYTQLKAIWPEIHQEVNKLEKVVKFNWSQDVFRPGTVLHQLAMQTKEFCTTALKRDIFARGDYKYLCELLAYFLGADIPNFSFKQPGAHHDARFMADCLYLLVLQMTQKYHPADSETVREDTLKKLVDATNYIVFFHGIFFLKSPMASQAPSNDLQAFKIAFQLQMMPDLKDFADIGKALNQSLLRHTWYLAPQLVVLALADKDLETEVKTRMVDKLLSFDFPEKKDLVMEKPAVQTAIVPMSALEDFINEQSYLLFLLLDISREEIQLWQEKGIEACENRGASQSFTYFSKCVTQLAVVNDRAERHIKLIQDFIGRTHNEDRLQDTLQVLIITTRTTGSI